MQKTANPAIRTLLAIILALTMMAPPPAMADAIAASPEAAREGAPPGGAPTEARAPVPDPIGGGSEDPLPDGDGAMGGPSDGALPDGAGEPEEGAGPAPGSASGKTDADMQLSALAIGSLPPEAASTQGSAIEPKSIVGDWFVYTGMTPGSLRNAINDDLLNKFGDLAYNRVTKLRISGVIGYSDFDFIGTYLDSLVELDLAGAVLEGTLYLPDIETIRLPAGVEIRDQLFYQYERLRTLKVGSGALVDGVVDLAGASSLGEESFYECKSIEKVRLPEGAMLPNLLFFGCTGLRTLKVGSGALTDGVVDLTGAASIGVNSFYNCEGIGTVRLPEGAVVTGNLLAGCTGLRTLKVGSGAFTDGVVDLTGAASFGTRSFAGCKGIEKVRLPEGAVISNLLFEECSSLKTLTVGGGPFDDGVVDLTGAASFEDDAFFWCKSIEKVRLPEGADLPAGLFERCAGLKTLKVGGGPFDDGVVDLTGASSYGKRVFASCHIIETVRLPEGAVLPNQLFSGCDWLRTIKVGDGPFEDGVIDLTGAASLGLEAFGQCYIIEKVRLPEGAALADQLFYYCRNLKTLKVGDGPFEDGVVDLTGTASFGSRAFDHCEGIVKVRLPEGAALADQLFNYCERLKTLKVGGGDFDDGVVDLTGVASFGGQSAFQNCSAIVSMKLSSYVHIPDYTFKNCSRLSEVSIIGGDAPTVGDSAFFKATAKGTLYYPNGASGYDAAGFPGLEGWTFVGIDYIAPAITGPASQTVTESDDEQRVGPYAIEGEPRPTVTLAGEDAAHVSWDGEAGMLVVEAGLVPGMYGVSIHAANGVGDPAEKEVAITVLPAPVVADPTENGVALQRNRLVAGESFTFTAEGHRQDAHPVVPGDERYVPSTWAIGSDEPTGFGADAPYTAEATLAEAGDYTLAITYQLQRWDGAAWADASGEVDVKTTGVPVSDGWFTYPDLEPGTLQARVEADLEAWYGDGQDYGRVERLRIAGALDDADFSFIRGKLTSLTDLDMLGVTSLLPAFALQDAKSIEAVRLPEGAALAERAFLLCTGLRTLKVGAGPLVDGVVDLTGVVVLGNASFEGCTGIETVRLPEGAAVSNGLFSNCTELRTLKVGAGPLVDGVVDLTGAASLGFSSFTSCMGIEAVRLPESVALPDSLFSACTGLRTLKVGAGPLVDGVVDLAGDTRLSPASFSGCEGIEEVWMHSGIPVPGSAFEFCSSLASISFIGGDAPELGAMAFAGLPGGGTMRYPLGAQGYDGSHFSDLADWEYVGVAFEPAFTADPEDRVALDGDEVTFSVMAVGDPAPALRWQRMVDGGWEDLSDGDTYSGTDTATLTIAAMAPALDNASYRCTAVNDWGSASSEAATLTLTRTAPAISGPGSLTLTVGYPAQNVGAYAITGSPMPVVTMTGADADELAWNGDTNMIGIPAGLQVGTYSITLEAGNGVGGPATLGFTLTVQPAPVVADPAENRVALQGTRITEGEAFDFAATGHRQGAVPVVSGDERYVPRTWAIGDAELTGTFPAGGPYGADATIDAAGGYTLTVTYQLQRWDGTAWADASGETDEKTANVPVSDGWFSYPDLVAGTLQARVEADLEAWYGDDRDYGRVVRLRIAGTMDATDFSFIKGSLPSLAELDLAGVTGALPVSALDGCTTVGAVRLPEGAAIPDYLFAGCTSLTTVALGDAEAAEGVIDLGGASSLGEGALSGCTSVEAVRLPADAEVPAYLLQDCTSLDTLWSAGSLPEPGVIDLRGTASLGAGALEGCTSVEAARLDEGAAIPEGLFLGCTSLSSVALGDTEPVEDVLDLSDAASLGEYAFALCPSATMARLPESAAIPDYLFLGCTGLAAAWSGDREIIDLGLADLSGAASLGESAFEGCTSIDEAKLPGDAAIPARLFKGCAILGTVWMEGAERNPYLADLTGAVAIGEGAFGGCTSLSTVWLPAGIALGGKAFAGCPSLDGLACMGAAPTAQASTFAGVAERGTFLHTAGEPGYGPAFFPGLESWEFAPIAFAAPEVVGQPVDQGAETGESVEFSITATGLPEPGYRWQSMADGGWADLEDDDAYSGTGTDTLTIAAMDASLDGTAYRCVATNILGTAESDAATLELVERPTLSGPDSLVLREGYAATTAGPFQAAGIPTPTVRKASGDEKVAYDGETGMLDIAEGLAAGTYEVVLEAGNGIADPARHAFTLTVTAKADPKGNSVALPEDGVVAGKSFILKAAGHLYDADDPAEGSERYVPRAWSVNPSGTFPEEGPFEAEVTIPNPGDHTLRVAFHLQRWEGGAWTDVADGIHELATPLTVAAPAPIDPVDPVDPVGPVDPADPSGPDGPTPPSPAKPDAPARPVPATQAGKPAPRTGDHAMAAAALATGAAALALAGTAAAHRRRRDGNRPR